MDEERTDPRNGDGWEEAVAEQGTPIPFGDEYFQSTHWLILSAEWRTGYCARCKQPARTTLHHLTYARVGRERPEDVIELCWICHWLQHNRRPAA